MEQARKARHVSGLQIRNLYLPADERQWGGGAGWAAGALHFTLRASAGGDKRGANAWIEHYTSEQVLPDLHLTWDAIPPCLVPTPLPGSTTSAAGTLPPCTVNPATGDCQLLQLTVTCSHVPQQRRRERQRRQRSVQRPSAHESAAGGATKASVPVGQSAGKPPPATVARDDLQLQELVVEPGGVSVHLEVMEDGRVAVRVFVTLQSCIGPPTSDMDPQQGILAVDLVISGQSEGDSHVHVRIRGAGEPSPATAPTALPSVEQSPRALSEACGGGREERQVLQLAFHTDDLVSVDLAALDSAAQGVNLAVFSLVDGSVAVLGWALAAAGWTFLPPLPVLLEAAQQDTQHVQELYDREGARPQVQASCMLPPPPMGSAELPSDGGALGWGPLPPSAAAASHEQANKQLVRWMADTGSAIAPLGTAHSLDDGTAALLDSKEVAAALVEAAAGMSPVPGSPGAPGFVPSMLGMLFGTSPGTMHSSRPSMLSADAQNPRLPPPLLTVAALRASHSAVSSPRHAASGGAAAHSMPAQSVAAALLARSSYSTMSPKSPLRPATPPALERLDGPAPASSQSFRAQRPPLSPGLGKGGGRGLAPHHRRAYSTSSAFFTVQQEPEHAAVLSRLSAMPDPAPSLGDWAQLMQDLPAPAAPPPPPLPDPPTRTPGRTGAGPGSASTATSGLAGLLLGRRPPDLDPLAAGPGDKVVVYDLEDLQSSTRRLLTVHSRLTAAAAKRENAQRTIMELMQARERSFRQEQAMAAGLAQLDDAANRAAAVLSELNAVRTRADALHTQLQRRVRQQQAASRTLKAASQELQRQREVLKGPQWLGQWRRLHADAVGHANARVATLADIYSLGPRGAAIQVPHAGTPSLSWPPVRPTRLEQPSLQGQVSDNPPTSQQPIISANPAPPSPAPQLPAFSCPPSTNGVGDGGASGRRRHGPGSGGWPWGAPDKGVGAPSQERRSSGSHRRGGSLPSIDDVMAALPLEQRLDSSWWAAGHSSACTPTRSSSIGSCGSSDEVEAAVRFALNAPSSPHTAVRGDTTSSEAGGSSPRAGLPGARQTPTAPAPAGMASSVAGRPVPPSGAAKPSSILPSKGSANNGAGGVRGAASVPVPATPLPGPGGDVPFCILGLELPANLAKRSLEGSVGWGSPDEEQRVAAGLGYVAHMVDRLSVYLGVPLRYPVLPAMSKSHICDPCPMMTPSAKATEGLLKRSVARLLGAAGGAAPSQSAPAPAQWLLGSVPSGLLRQWPATGQAQGGAHMQAATQPPTLDPRAAPPPVVLPLYTDGRDLTRFAYAVYLLNKDVELLLQAHGLASHGPNQLLRNLHTLALAALSGV